MEVECFIYGRKRGFPIVSNKVLHLEGFHKEFYLALDAVLGNFPHKDKPRSIEGTSIGKLSDTLKLQIPL